MYKKYMVYKGTQFRLSSLDAPNAHIERYKSQYSGLVIMVVIALE